MTLRLLMIFGLWLTLGQPPGVPAAAPPPPSVGAAVVGVDPGTLQPPPPLNQRSIPRGVALVIGAVQALIIVGATVLALILPGRRGPRRSDGGS